MKRTFTLVLAFAVVLILAGCTTSNPSAAPRATTAPTGGAAARAADTWSPGSSWAYRYESPRGSGTFEWVVDREEILDGVRFYVVTAGPGRSTSGRATWLSTWRS
jgi:outer membrane biogenesis lipoprotein LolB